MKSALRLFATLVAISCASFTAVQAQQVDQDGNPIRYQSSSTNSSTSQQRDPLQRGNFAIGSGIGYFNTVSTVVIEHEGSIKTGGNQGYQFHITPSIGYFLANNFVFGLGMDYNLNSVQDNTANTDNQHTIDTRLLFGPYARVYLPFAGNQAFFLGAVYGYGNSRTEIGDAGDIQTVNTHIMSFGAGPGYSIFSNGRVSLEAQAKYNYGLSRNSFLANGSSQSTRTNSTSWDFVLGIHFYFQSR